MGVVFWLLPLAVTVARQRLIFTTLTVAPNFLRFNKELRGSCGKGIICLFDMDGEHGHVVVLRGIADKAEDIGFDVVEQVGGVIMAMLFDGEDELVESPLFVFVVHGFGDAVGVGDDQVAGLELNIAGFGDGFKGGIVYEPNSDASGFGAVDLVAAVVEDEGGFVTGSGVAEEAGFGIEHHV